MTHTTKKKQNGKELRGGEKKKITAVKGEKLAGGKGEREKK